MGGLSATENSHGKNSHYKHAEKGQQRGNKGATKCIATFFGFSFEEVDAMWLGMFPKSLHFAV